VSFKPGDRVVCVDGSPTTCWGRQELAEGSTYRVQMCLVRFPCVVEHSRDDLPLPLTCVTLEEVKGDCCGCFPARRFKPATDISALTRLLDVKEHV